MPTYFMPNNRCLKLTRHVNASNCSDNSASVLSPRIAASATFDLKLAEWLRCFLFIFYSCDYVDYLRRRHLNFPHPCPATGVHLCATLYTREGIMKQQIKRISPHQNGKVFAILMTVGALLILIPMAILMSFAAPQVYLNGNSVEYPIFVLVIMPFFYLVFGYIFIVIWCTIYNYFFRYIGGFEFEIEEKDNEY